MKVLIIGLGSIAKKHIKALKQIDKSIEIFALRSSANSEEIDDAFNIYKYNQFNGKPDFIVISNPTSLHENTIRDVLFFGCPLFIEKPVLSSLENSDIILNLIKTNKTVTYVACNLRFHPSLVYLKKYLDLNKPRVNEVNIYCGSYLPEWRPDKDFRKIYSANKELGGGVNLDLIHEIDYCTWLFGFPLNSMHLFSSNSSLNIDSFDSAHYIFQYSEFNVNITLNYFRRDPKRTIEIVTENDTIIVDLIKNKVCSVITGKILFENEFNISDTYLKQMQYFIQCLNGDLNMNDLENGLQVLKLAINE